MSHEQSINNFLSQFPEQVAENASLLRKVLIQYLPEIQEQIDLPAKMIAYCYGQKYAEMICTIIPSQKGLKLGFYKGADLIDPENLLKGSGKLSRYVEIKKPEDIYSNGLTVLLKEALKAYRKRVCL